MAIGIALIVEAFIPQTVGGVVPDQPAAQVIVGVGIGLGIGLVSSLLDVAGGELIIPTFVFAFGADIKVAGTTSLFVSLPVILVGIGRYVRRGAYHDRGANTGTVAPMGLGSVIAAIIGGLLVGIISAAVLKLVLGVILIVSALRIFRHEPSPR